MLEACELMHESVAPDMCDGEPINHFLRNLAIGAEDDPRGLMTVSHVPIPQSDTPYPRRRHDL